jgi:hypothetical protein
MGRRERGKGRKTEMGKGRNGGERDAISRIRVWCETYYA